MTSRPQAIYEPAGRAQEYAELACNLYENCNGGCRYCYVPGCRHITRERFRSGVAPRRGILAALEKECRAYEGDPRRVMFCFTCDPFPDTELAGTVTAQALQTLGNFGVWARTLTKFPMVGLSSCLSQLKAFSVDFGVTLCWTNPDDQRRWEPGVESIYARLTALREARSEGLYTWLSLEPVIDPAQARDVIEMVGRLDLVKEIRVGKVNHLAEVERSVDWQKFYGAVVAAAAHYPTIKFYIKRDLARAAGPEAREGLLNVAENADRSDRTPPPEAGLSPGASGPVADADDARGATDHGALPAMQQG